MTMPNAVLMSTAQNATERVNLNANTTSGCCRASSTGARPLENVAFATSATGQITRKNR
jgi:hypothetical protein